MRSVKPIRASFVFRIDRCSVYTGKINKNFLHLDFILKFGLYRILLFRVQFRQISLYKFWRRINITIQTCSTEVIYCFDFSHVVVRIKAERKKYMKSILKLVHNHNNEHTRTSSVWDKFAHLISANFIAFLYSSFQVGSYLVLMSFLLNISEFLFSPSSWYDQQIKFHSNFL